MEDRIPDRIVFSMELKETRILLTGHLTFYDSIGQIATIVATSGLPGGYQSPKHYRTHRKGLCPPYKKYFVNTTGYHLNTIGVEGTFFHVTPDPVPGYGRSELGIHADKNVPGSSGCVVVSNEHSYNNRVVPLFRLAAGAGISRLPLEIDYKIEEIRAIEEAERLQFEE